jgi:hypothetical protein
MIPPPSSPGTDYHDLAGEAIAEVPWLNAALGIQQATVEVDVALTNRLEDDEEAWT